MNKFDIRKIYRANRSKRHVLVFWSNNTALLNSDHYDTYKNDPKIGMTRKVDGTFLVEIPLATRHVGDVIYGYEVTTIAVFPI